MQVAGSLEGISGIKHGKNFLNQGDLWHLGYSPALELGHSPALELRHSPTLELGYSPALELGYSPALELGYSPALELGCNPMMELGRKRTLPHGKHFKPEVRHKNNKALIKAEDLKGSLDTRRVKSLDLAR